MDALPRTVDDPPIINNKDHASYKQGETLLYDDDDDDRALTLITSLAITDTVFVGHVPISYQQLVFLTLSPCNFIINLKLFHTRRSDRRTEKPHPLKQRHGSNKTKVIS